jgi:hypothetical protein
MHAKKEQTQSCGQPPDVDFLLMTLSAIPA